MAELVQRSSALSILALLLWTAPGSAQDKEKAPIGTIKAHKWTVDGTAREALVYIPPHAKAQPSALVFAFHGGSGKMGDAAKAFAIHKHWPAAIVVYPQGLMTPVQKEIRLGWQYLPGEQEDRDVLFFDQMLADLSKQYRVDEKRVFTTGFSNGGGFSTVLWSTRSDKLAATASVCMQVFDKVLNEFTPKPKPFLMVAGKDDGHQTLDEMRGSIKKVLKLNECGVGSEWYQKGRMFYPSKIDAPVVFMVSDGGHEVSSAAQTAVVDFFNEIKPGKGRSKLVGDWLMKQPTIGEAIVRITEKDGKLYAREFGNRNATGTKVVYRDGFVVINWQVNDNLKGFWALHLDADHRTGYGKTVIGGQTDRTIEGVTVERIEQKKR